MTSPAVGRFFFYLPAVTLVQPKKVQRKSLIVNYLPITYLFPRFCTKNAMYLHENKDSEGEGRVSLPRFFPPCPNAIIRTLSEEPSCAK